MFLELQVMRFAYPLFRISQSNIAKFISGVFY